MTATFYEDLKKEFYKIILYNRPIYVKLIGESWPFLKHYTSMGYYKNSSCKNLLMRSFRSCILRHFSFFKSFPLWGKLLKNALYLNWFSFELKENTCLRVCRSMVQNFSKNSKQKNLRMFILGFCNNNCRV